MSDPIADNPVTGTEDTPATDPPVDDAAVTGEEATGTNEAVTTTEEVATEGENLDQPLESESAAANADYVPVLGEDPMFVDDILAQHLYLPPNFAEQERIKAEQVYKDQVAEDVVRGDEMQDIIMGGTGLAILGVFAVWALLSLFSIGCVHRRWCSKLTLRSTWDKFQVNMLMVFASIQAILAVATVFLFKEITLRYMIAMVFLSNISYIWSIMFVLGMSKASPHMVDGSFARIRTTFLFSGFFQMVVLVLSQADGMVGGTCETNKDGTTDKSVPYLFDMMYGLMFFAQFVFILEKLFGFGAKKTSRKAEGEAKTEDKLEVENDADLKSEIIFQQMAYFAFIFTLILAAIKLGLLIMNILFVREGDVLYCTADNDKVQFITDTGLQYVALFAAQLLIGAEHLRVVTYEGAIAAGVFPGLSTTFCRSILTCCRKAPEWTDIITVRKPGPVDESALEGNANESAQGLTNKSKGAKDLSYTKHNSPIKAFDGPEVDDVDE